MGVTINPAPADLRKEGWGFDLPMALGVVGCLRQFFGKALDQMMFLGELSLDGSVRPVRGARERAEERPVPIFLCQFPSSNSTFLNGSTVLDY